MFDTDDNWKKLCEEAEDLTRQTIGVAQQVEAIETHLVGGKDDGLGALPEIPPILESSCFEYLFNSIQDVRRRLGIITLRLDHIANGSEKVDMPCQVSKAS